MTQKVKAHLFHVDLSDGTPEDVKPLLRAFADKKENIEVSDGAHSFCVCDTKWSPKTNTFGATVLRVRSDRLPSLVAHGRVYPLPIKDNEDLGEPMCFLYRPDWNSAIVQYSHTGPRYSILPAILSKLGYPHPVTVEAMLRRDMLERLEHTGFVRSFSFGLRGSKNDQKLRAQGTAVTKALDIMGDLQGLVVRVEVSVGRKHQSLTVDTVKKLGKRLAHFGDAEIDKLELLGAEKEDQKADKLDLLGGRIEIPLEVSENGRELDRVDCSRKLTAAFDQYADEIKKRAKGD